MTSHSLNVLTERLETLFWTSRLGLDIIRLVYNPGTVGCAHDIVLTCVSTIQPAALDSHVNVHEVARWLCCGATGCLHKPGY